MHISKKSSNFAAESCKDYGTVSFFEDIYPRGHSLDVNDNRRHLHVFKKGSRHLRSVAKIWIEKNGEKCIEIAESELTAKENNMIVAAIDRHWELLNNQISKTFRGEKTQPKNIEK